LQHSIPIVLSHNNRLSNQSTSCSTIILERRGNLLLRFVIPSQSVNSALDENQPKLGVLVFPVSLQVLTHGNRLFDEVPKVLRNGWAKSMTLQNTKNFISSDKSNLRNSMRISQSYTDLRRGQTLTSELDDVVDDILGGGFQP